MDTILNYIIEHIYLLPIISIGLGIAVRVAMLGYNILIFIRNVAAFTYYIVATIAMAIAYLIRSAYRKLAKCHTSKNEVHSLSCHKSYIFPKKEWKGHVQQLNLKLTHKKHS